MYVVYITYLSYISYVMYAVYIMLGSLCRVGYGFFSFFLFPWRNLKCFLIILLQIHELSASLEQIEPTLRRDTPSSSSSSSSITSYVCVCVCVFMCVCVCIHIIWQMPNCQQIMACALRLFTNIYLYIPTYVCVCVCVRCAGVCVWVSEWVSVCVWCRQHRMCSLIIECVLLS